MQTSTKQRDPALILVDEFIALIRQSGATQVEAAAALCATNTLLLSLDGISFSNESRAREEALETS
jgi:hypothetical protein